ncbi:CHAT domain protein [Ceratobasidium sp. AG-Ba]|nr:CHAT domain protein [Ceratobasidium sp. AG-Ba]
MPDADSMKPALLHNFALALRLQFMRTSEMGNLDDAISFQQSSISLSPENNPLRSQRLKQLAELLRTRYQKTNNTSTLDQAISAHEQALLALDEGSQEKRDQLGELGRTLLSRYEHFGRQDDFDRTVQLQLEYLRLSSADNSAKKAEALSNLGSSHLSRYQRTGDLTDLNKTAEYHKAAYHAAGDKHPDIDGFLYNLGLSLTHRFVRLSQDNDINAAIPAYERLVEITPAGHPLRATRLDSFGSALMSRFERYGRIEDVDLAISSQELAVSLATTNSTDLAHYSDNLGCSFLRRFDRLQNISDLNKAIENLKKAYQLTPEGNPKKGRRTNLLGSAIKRRGTHTKDAAEFDRGIDLINSAVSMVSANDPNGASWMNNRSSALLARFRLFGQVSDIDAAINSQTQCVAKIPHGRRERPMYISTLGVMFLARFKHLGEMADLEKSIEYRRQAIQAAPTGHPRIPILLVNLAVSLLRKAEALEILSPCDEAIGHMKQAMELQINVEAVRAQVLRIMGNAYTIKWVKEHIVSDLDEAIRYHEDALRVLPNHHLDRRHYLSSLAKSLSHRGTLTHQLSCIDRSISLVREAIALTPEKHSHLVDYSANLGEYLLHRYCILKDPGDAASYTKVMLDSIRLLSASPIRRFSAARRLIDSMADMQLPGSLEVYQLAMDLVPAVIWLGTRLTGRYASIRSTGIGSLANDAAAFAISHRQYDQAIEWLEEGRSIVWNQIRQLRAPLGELRLLDSALLDRLVAVSQGLESGGMGATQADSVEAATQAQHQLAEEWQALLQRVREIPGHHHFLRPRTSLQLASAANSSTIVLINVHRSRCDALSFRQGSTAVVHIPLPELSFESVSDMHSRWQASLRASLTLQRGFRKDVKHQTDPNHDFRTVLGQLWSEAAQPILIELGLMNSVHERRKLPRVTWCLTGPLSFLPFHAAGQYKQEATRSKLYNFVVSSYSPSIAALLSPPPSIDRFQGILAVGQSATPGWPPLEHIRDELDCIERLAGDLRLTRVENSGATVSAVKEQMNNHTWLHFACHASQDFKDPLKSALRLHDGSLNLAQISRDQLQTTEFAFLSACETATGTEALSEEAVHLAAGILMSGCPSVIASLWSVGDNDAPIVAERVYRGLIEGGEPNIQNAAYALHDAVKDLREKTGEGDFNAWAPYIHVGV